MAQRVFDSFSMSPLMLPIRLEILVLSNAVLLFLLIILNSAGVHIHGAVCRHIGDVQLADLLGVFHDDDALFRIARLLGDSMLDQSLAACFYLDDLVQLAVGNKNQLYREVRRRVVVHPVDKIHQHPKRRQHFVVGVSFSAVVI